MKLFFSIILSLSISLTLLAQNEDVLKQFTAVQVGNHVQLDFTIQAGNTCNGIQIYRSSDSLIFEEIGDIQGVCGSSDRNESYSFTDFTPLNNAANYYRLQLGTLGFTYTVKVFFIELNGNDALIYPNPLTGESSINILNSSHAELRLKIFSSDGKLFYESDGLRGNSFALKRKDFSGGVYFFQITGSSVVRYKGTFLVK